MRSSQWATSADLPSPEGPQGEDVSARIRPGLVEPGELGLPADEVRAGDGQAADVEEGGRGRGHQLEDRRAGRLLSERSDLEKIRDLLGEGQEVFLDLNRAPSASARPSVGRPWISASQETRRQAQGRTISGMIGAHPSHGARAAGESRCRG